MVAFSTPIDNNNYNSDSDYFTKGSDRHFNPIPTNIALPLIIFLLVVILIMCIGYRYIFIRSTTAANLSSSSRNGGKMLNRVASINKSTKKNGPMETTAAAAESGTKRSKTTLYYYPSVGPTAMNSNSSTLGLAGGTITTSGGIMKRNGTIKGSVIHHPIATTTTALPHTQPSLWTEQQKIPTSTVYPTNLNSAATTTTVTSRDVNSKPDNPNDSAIFSYTANKNTPAAGHLLDYPPADRTEFISGTSPDMNDPYYYRQFTEDHHHIHRTTADRNDGSTPTHFRAETSIQLQQGHASEPKEEDHIDSHLIIPVPPESTENRTISYISAPNTTDLYAIPKREHPSANLILDNLLTTPEERDPYDDPRTEGQSKIELVGSKSVGMSSNNIGNGKKTVRFGTNSKIYWSPIEYLMTADVIGSGQGHQETSSDLNQPDHMSTLRVQDHQFVVAEGKNRSKKSKSPSHSGTTKYSNSTLQWRPIGQHSSNIMNTLRNQGQPPPSSGKISLRNQGRYDTVVETPRKSKKDDFNPHQKNHYNPLDNHNFLYVSIGGEQEDDNMTMIPEDEYDVDDENRSFAQKYSFFNRGIGH